MSVTFNPFTGNLDFNDTTKAAGSDTQVQFNDGGKLGGDSGLVFNKTTNKLTAGGDVELNDGGSFTTTLQTVTPTANRTISFPDATGTVGLVAGSSGSLIQNLNGAYAGVSTMTFDGTSVTLAGRLINSYTSLASSPAKVFTGTWFTGGTSTTTKPHFLIEPSGATSTAWSTSGTGFGVNAASGFAGNLLDLQVNGTSQLKVNQQGDITSGGGNVFVPDSRGYRWLSRGGITAPGDGQFQLNNNASSGFSLLRFGGGTTSFPALKRNSAVLETKLADDTDYAQHAAAVFEAAKAYTVATLPGTPVAGMIARVTDATAPAVGSTVAGGGAAAALVWYNGANWSVIGV